jgi:hypothetical protein
MKAIKQAVVVSLIAAIAASESSFAVPDTKIAIRCPDVVLWWPSTNGQSFLIQGRPDLNPETTWTTLTNFYPAALNTNRTYFVHSNQVDCPSGQTFGMLSASGGGSASASAKGSSISLEKPFQLLGLGPWLTTKDESRMPVPLDIYPPGIDLSGHIIIWPDGSTDEWTKELAGKYEEIKNEGQRNGPQPADAGGGDGGVTMAFYRVINVAPVARPNIFGVEQDSVDNQLNILFDDSEPNDDPILISAVTSAQHGGFQYSLDGSIFQYTPDNGFYGVDSFTYSITNRHGSWSTATVTVFVNQSGNSIPTAEQVIITLATNNYSAVLNVLTNATDPDADTLALFALGTVRLGTLSSNGNGIVTYQRNPDWFGHDEFTYVVTDGRGGHAIGSVAIDQVDSDADGMPDEYENRSWLDYATDDSTADPDGDGLPNLAEFKLHTNPHASDNPLNISVTNGTALSGFVQLPLAKLSPVIEKQPIALYVNGDQAATSFLWQGPDGQWLLNWNTGFLTNGNYSIKAGFQYKHEVPLTEDSTFFGQTNSVQITNLITFAELTSQFTDFLLIDAKLAVQNATYRVDLYDEDGTLLVYGVFTTTNGSVQLSWDLTDGNGNQLAFGSVKSEFRIGPPGTTDFSSLDTTPQWFLKEASTTGTDFVVAWGWDVQSFSFDYRREQAMLNGVINLIDQNIIGNGYRLRPAANVALASTFRFDSRADGELLLDELGSASAGNFFWFGHSGKDFIAGNVKKADIGSGDVEHRLMNKAHRSTPRVPRTNAHPYKLVILNGCENYTAEWANAFGMDFAPDGSTTTSLSYFFAGRIPRAFVGWKNQIDVPNRLGSLVGYETQYSEALAYFFYNWMQGNFLTYSLNQYANRMAFHGFDGHDSWRISGCTTMTRSD